MTWSLISNIITVNPNKVKTMSDWVTIFPSYAKRLKSIKCFMSAQGISKPFLISPAIFEIESPDVRNNDYLIRDVAVPSEVNIKELDGYRTIAVRMNCSVTEVLNEQ